MRLWSLHPQYLDAKGIVALWRETLLAQKVLAGQTKGYKHHPQLIRFRATSNAQGAIATYLRAIIIESQSRAYNFDKNKILNRRFCSKISVTEGQIYYEYTHLANKLSTRDPAKYAELPKIEDLIPHPLFKVIPGDVESWEII